MASHFPELGAVSRCLCGSGGNVRTQQTTEEEVCERHCKPLILVLVMRHNALKDTLLFVDMNLCRHNIDDERKALEDACTAWMQAIGPNRLFLGGDKPNLADLVRIHYWLSDLRSRSLSISLSIFLSPTPLSLSCNFRLDLGVSVFLFYVKRNDHNLAVSLRCDELFLRMPCIQRSGGEGRNR